MRSKIHIGRTPDDSEKMVLPGIIFANVRHPNFAENNAGLNGFLIAAGWWDWSIKWSLLWRQP